MLKIVSSPILGNSPTAVVVVPMSFIRLYVAERFFFLIGKRSVSRFTELYKF